MEDRSSSKKVAARNLARSWRDSRVMMIQKTDRFLWDKAGGDPLDRSPLLPPETGSGSNDRSTPSERLEVTIGETREPRFENRVKTWRDLGAVTEITVPLR